MIIAYRPPDEIKRLEALYALNILDTPREERFDRITRLAARLFDVPIVLITLLDRDRQWFKACYGASFTETSRDVSFCSHAILGEGLLVIEDARTDERFFDNPLVTGEPFIQFYAGCPLLSSDGSKVGILCLIDSHSRKFSQADQTALEDLAKLVEKEMLTNDLARTIKLARENEQRTLVLFDELASQRELTTNLFQQCAVAVVAINLEHKVIVWNKATEELTGYGAAEMLGTSNQWKAFFGYERPTLGDLLVDEAYDKVPLYYKNYVQGSNLAANAVHAEGWFDNMNGRRRYLKFDTSPVYNKYNKLVAAITTLQDATQQKQTDAQLQQQRDFGLQVMTTMGQGLIVTNTGGSFDYVNPVFAELAGFAPSELEGRQVLDTIFENEYDNIRTMWRRLLMGEKVNYETLLKRADGSGLDVLVTAVPRYQDGQIIGTISVITDLTERKRIERLKNEFISTVSHELRTPLTSIRGSLGLVIGGVAGELSPTALSMVEIAQKNSERLGRLINDILDIEKIESGKMQFNLKPRELLPLLQQTIEVNQGYAEQYKVIFKLEPAAPGLKSLVDSDRLTQVVTNLLSNAAKFSQAGDSVIIKLTENKSFVRLSVSDQGAGIAEDFQQHIFQKFAQADSSSTRQQGGTGLGLSISKAIVEHMHGQIGFDTVVGAGTTFWVDLPRYYEDVGEAPINHLDPSSPRILVCEDNYDINKLLCLILEETGLQIDSAYRVSEARELLNKYGSRYVAMTLDLLLPDQDGISFMREIRQNPVIANLPVIVVSAKAGAGKVEIKGSAVSVVDWINKPIDQTRLLAAVAQTYHRNADNLSKPSILHLEDDLDIVRVVATILQDVAQVISAKDLQQARQHLASQNFDLILVDLELPDGNGLDILGSLHQQDRCSPPVVVFSANEISLDTAQKVSAALIKSRTSNQELVATIRALIMPGSPVPVPAGVVPERTENA